MCTNTCTFTCTFTCAYYVCNVLICRDYRDVHIYMYKCILYSTCMYMYNYVERCAYMYKGILYMYMYLHVHVYVQRCGYMYKGILYIYMYSNEYCMYNCIYKQIKYVIIIMLTTAFQKTRICWFRDL